MQNKIADEIVAAVDRTRERLTSVAETEAQRKPMPGKWSAQEIIGHLIDSAANNHQRFVLALESEPLRFPRYTQDHWVEVQAYNNASWPGVLALWQTYNHHLAHVIRNLQVASLGVTCVIGDNKPVTLGFLVEDYLDHMNHHLAQIEKTLST